MWLPWRKPAAVFVSENRLLVEGFDDTFEDVITEKPVEELSRLIDRANKYRTSIFVGAGLVRLTAVPRVAKLRTRAEKQKAASALAQLPLSDWHLTVVDPSADSSWLIYAMPRAVYERLATLRSDHDGRVRSVKPYSGVVFDSLLVDAAEDRLIGVYEVENSHLSWLIISGHRVKSAGQVLGITHELLASETTRLALAGGVAQGNVRLMIFDPSSIGRGEVPRRTGSKSVAFEQRLLPA